jgi:hypothetical protein
MLTALRMKEIHQRLQMQKPETLSELIAIFGKADAWLFLGLGIVGVDLEIPISDVSKIFINGGHRHADIFA